MDDLLAKMADMTKEQRELFLSQANATKKQIDQQEKTGQKEETNDKTIYDAFQNALKIYEAPTHGERKTNGMCFYRDKNPVYFYTLDTNVTNPITKKVEWTTEIKYIMPGNLYPNFTELRLDRSREFLRDMVEGKTINVKNPETNQYETYKFNRKVYDKLTNTVKIVDDKTFNMLNLDNRIKPNYDAEVLQACPLIHQALLASVSGNDIDWNEELQAWQSTKEENQRWLEAWLYGVSHASIGNNQLAIPIIFGKGKVGKNALFDMILPGILGAQVCFSGVWDVINSGFNQFRLGKVFMFIDEAPERSDWSTVKNWSGSPRSYVKVKYGAEFEIDNCIAYAIGSNHENYPFPFEDGKQMIRVSPIKTSGSSTFAENTYKILEHHMGKGFCLQMLKDNDISVNENDPFAIGDALLRGPLLNEWTSRESLQQLMNYLDQNYKKDTSYYYLEPLRGQDWDDISSNRKNAIDITAEYITAHSSNIVTMNELYEIYKVVQNERHNNDTRRLYHFNNFSTTIKPMMKDMGWEFKRNNKIANGTSPDIFTRGRIDYGNIKRHIEDWTIYIVDTPGPSGPIKRLKAHDDFKTPDTDYLKTRDELFKKMTQR